MGKKYNLLLAKYKLIMWRIFNAWSQKEERKFDRSESTEKFYISCKWESNSRLSEF